MIQANPNPSSFTVPMPLPREIRALLLDDSNFDRARIRRLSNRTNLAIQLDEVESIAQMSDAVSNEIYDLILIDYRLPVGDGIEALDYIQQNAQNRGAGKIMITGDGAQQIAIDAMRGGCHDFLSKEEMDVAALRSAMVNALQAVQHHQQLQVQSDIQDEIIKRGLIAAMQDDHVQGNVVSLVRQHVKDAERNSRFRQGDMNSDDLETILASLGDEDDFIFH
ncbi:MAG: response regulator [Sulfitobacter sp.]